MNHHAEGCELEDRGYCTCGFSWWASQQQVIQPLTSSVIQPGCVVLLPTQFVRFPMEQALGWTP